MQTKFDVTLVKMPWLALLLLACLPSCSGTTPAADAQAGAPITLTLLAEDSGKTLEVAVGDRVQLQLAENPSTGYQWAVDTVEASRLLLEGSDYAQDPEGRAGSWGTRTFRFRILAPGEAPLRLKYWRQWEGDRSIVNRFALTVRIRPRQ